MVLIHSETGLEMLRFEVLALVKLIEVLIEKIKSPGLSQDELDFWTARITALHAVAASDAAIIETLNDLDAILHDAVLLPNSTSPSPKSLIAH